MNKTIAQLMCLLLAMVGCGDEDARLIANAPPQPADHGADDRASTFKPVVQAPERSLSDAAWVDVMGVEVRQPEMLKHPERYAPWTSSRAMVVHDDRLFIVDEERDELVVMDRFSGQVRRRIVVGQRPRHVVVDADGAAWVTSQGAGTVSRIAPGASVVERVREVGLGPIGMGLEPDGTTLAVAVTGEAAVRLLDADSLQPLWSDRMTDGGRAVVVSGQPQKLTVTVAGKTGQVDRWILFRKGGAIEQVQHITPQLRASLPYQHKLSLGCDDRDALPSSALGAVQHPDCSGALVAHQMAFIGSETSSVETGRQALRAEAEALGYLEPLPEPPSETRGYGAFTAPQGCGGRPLGELPLTPQSHEPAVTVLGRLMGHHAQYDRQGRPLSRALVLPSDINHHPQWAIAAVAGKASDTLVLMDTSVADPMSFISAVIHTQAAPTAVSFSRDGRHLYVLHAHDRTVGVIDLWDLYDVEDNQGRFIAGQPMTIPVRTAWVMLSAAWDVEPVNPQERLGRRAFTFARTQGLNQDGALSCEMCHIEGTEDGLVWFTSDGPRQTPLLAGRVPNTAPFNWLGTEETLVGNVAQTVEQMGGQGLDLALMDAIEEFMHTMAGPPPLERPLTPLEREGQVLFFDPVVACADCHSGSSTTDGRQYDVGTASDVEKSLMEFRVEFSLVPRSTRIRYNTPSLSHLRTTAPYLHDGSAATLMEVLERTATTMGRTDHLTEHQRQALVAYLLTL